MRLASPLGLLLALAACEPGTTAPGPPTIGEASALADAEAMLEERAARQEPASDQARIGQ